MLWHLAARQRINPAQFATLLRAALVGLPRRPFCTRFFLIRSGAPAAVGMGGTTVWRLCSLNASTSLCLFFDIVGSKESAPDANSMASQQLFLQFQTKYTTLEGEGRMRVVTITRHWTDGGNVQDIIAGFDQEASAVAIARLLSSKMESEEEFNATRWLDRTLIRMCSRFGDYRSEDPSSFQLSQQMSIYPQFMFNLRRSQFVQVFNNSLYIFATSPSTYTQIQSYSEESSQRL